MRRIAYLALTAVVVLAMAMLTHNITGTPWSYDDTVTLSDAYMMTFTKDWGTATVTKTNIAGPGVRFDCTGVVDGTGIRDNYPVNHPTLGNDFTGYGRYAMVVTNVGTGLTQVSLMMNTGYTNEDPDRDSFWSSGWYGIAAGESRIYILDFSSCGWSDHTSDDPEWPEPDGSSGIQVRRLDEVTSIGIEVHAGDWTGPQDCSLVLSRTPSIESCDNTGTQKDSFNPSDTIRIKGDEFEASTTYTDDVYVVSDVTTWTDQQTIPSRVAGTVATVTSDANGDIGPIIVWSPSLTPGKYDIVVDFDGDGKYDDGVDALDDNDIVTTAGFFVIPEYALGTILAIAICFAGVGVYVRSKRTQKKPL